MVFQSMHDISILAKAQRKRHKLTQRQLAGAAGVGLRFVVDFEKGKPTCQIDKVIRVLWMLGIRLQPVGDFEDE